MSIGVPRGSTVSVPRGSTLRYARVPGTVLYDKRLSAYSRLVYGDMAMWVYQGRTCSVGVRQMAVRLGFANSTVHEAIQELAAAGVITVSKSGKGKRTMYTLVSPVFGQKQGQETVVVSAPGGARRMVSVGPEVKTA